MNIENRYYDNETNEAIEFAIHARNELIDIERYYPKNCVLRELNRTNPGDIIFDIQSENNNTSGILTINDGRYTRRGQIVTVNTVYCVECLINNYNGVFLLVGVNTINEILDLVRFLKEVVDYEYNNQYYLDYVSIPPNLLNKWFISDNCTPQNN